MRIEDTDDLEDDGPHDDAGGLAGAPPPVPYERFKEVNDKLAALQAAAAEREATERAAAEASAAADEAARAKIAALDLTIAELTAKAALADRLVEIFTEQTETEALAWPEEARDMLAIAETIDKRLEILPKARALARKLAGGPSPFPPGGGNQPAPGGRH